MQNYKKIAEINSGKNRYIGFINKNDGITVPSFLLNALALIAIFSLLLNFEIKLFRGYPLTVTEDVNFVISGI